MNQGGFAVFLSGIGLASVSGRELRFPKLSYPLLMLQKYFLLPVGFLIAAGLSAQTRVLLNDSFISGSTGYIGKSGANNSGTPGVQAPDSGPNSSAFWYGNGSTYSYPTAGTNPILYANNQNGNGSLSLNPTSFNGLTQSVTAYFESPGSYQSIDRGGTLKVSFDFNGFSKPSRIGTSTGIRFLLFNSGSTDTVNNQLVKNSGDSGGAYASFSNYSGYFVGFNPAAATHTALTAIYTRSTPGSANIITTNPAPENKLGGNRGKGPGLTGSDTYRATLTLTYNDSGGNMTIEFGLTDVTNPSNNPALADYATVATDTGDPNPIVTSFDGLTIGALGAVNTPLTITNVRITYTKPGPPLSPPAVSPPSGN